MNAVVEPRDPFDLCGVTIDGKYRVASVIGDGGFGVVYRGVHKGFGEVIAIKCLKLPASLDEEARNELLEKLQDEGRLLHRLSKATSGIVQALDVGAFTTDANVWVPYLIMEWLEGETLAEFLKRRESRGDPPLTLEETVALLEPAAKALGVAHAQKVAHRDVKPANIFVSDVGGKKTTKVLDFGIAKVLSDHRGYTTALENTNMAPTAFTPRYGAPEQFNKQRGATGPWTDVFALALVFVECVSGRKALEGDDPTQLYIASADPALRPTLRARGIEVSESVENVIRKAIEVEPKKRYANANDFWAELDAAVRGIPIARSSLPGSGPGSGQRPVSSGKKPRPATGESDSLLDTSEFAAKHQLMETGGVVSKSALSPTIPVEMMKTKKEASLEDTDAGRKAGQTSLTSIERERGSMLGWLGVGAIVFAGGGYFAYRTLTTAVSPDVQPSASAVTSGSTSAKRSNTPPRVPPTASVRPSASASASPLVSASAAPSAAPTLTPTATATVKPTVSPSATSAPPPVDYADMIKLEGGTVKFGEEGIDTAVSAFFIDQTEVTARRFKACINASACRNADSPLGISDEATWKPLCNVPRANAQNHPANCVTFTQAEAYCIYMGKRLPTEVEWEFAARGSESNKFVWGSADATCSSACYDRDAGCKGEDPLSSCAVGSFAPDKTATQAKDFAGNVSEWVAEGTAKGGNFFDGAALLDLTLRTRHPAGYAHPTVGFRCAAN